MFVEKWKLVGPRSERINLVDGRSGVIVDSTTPPFAPLKDGLFSRLKKDGVIQPVMVRVDNSDTLITPEPLSTDTLDEMATTINSNPDKGLKPLDVVHPEDSESEDDATSEPSDPIESHDESSDGGVDVESVLISSLGLTPKTVGILEDNGLVSVSDMKGITSEYLATLDGLGPKRIEEILEAIAPFLLNT